MRVVQERKNQASKTTIYVVDNRDASFMDDDVKWYAVCDDHGSLLSTETRKEAGYHAVVPSWCEECSAIMYENGFYTYTSDDIGSPDYA
tara:strand:+ start:95 stop:361 length:267 start_codon:yes stop_codon:yes gene_type:complete